jgi:membrane protease subunit HflC
MMHEVRDQIRPAAKALGIEIDDVRIRRTDLTQEVSQQTYDRMKAERLAQAEKLRARGRESAQRIKARADREAVEIIAEANKESEVLRGEGDAKRSAIYAKAYEKDPKFFQFYRSMSAYETALDKTGTTMVLSPDSDFFRYFNNPMGSAGEGAGSGSPPPANPPSSPSAK